MPARIRLQRHGKKGRPFYHIVIADGRAPRDGKYIERIGTYNPVTKPADIQLDIEKAIEWLKNGAQPSDTARSILSYAGVLYKYHLLKGVKKGALTEEQAEAKFQTWLKEKEAAKMQNLKDAETTERNARKKRHEAEVKIKEQRAGEIAKRKAAEVGMELKAEEQSEAATEEAAAEAAGAVAEEKQENKEESPAEEATAETPGQDTEKEEPKAE